jgi:hypothetical protein
VIERVLPPKKNKNTSNSVWWKCKCIECGKIKDFNGSELRLNRVGACRHKTKQEKIKRVLEYSKAVINEVGNRYGKLTVKSFAYSKNGKAYWNVHVAIMLLL